MIFLLMIISFILSVISTFGQKKLQTIFPENKLSYDLYTFLTGVLCTIEYLILAGFRPAVNWRILLISFIYAVICRLNYVVVFRSLKYLGIILNSAISKVGSIVLPIILSAVFLGEVHGVGTIIGAICIMAASILPGIHMLKDKKEIKAKILWAIPVILFGLCTIMFQKIVVAFDGTDGYLSLLLFTNVFLILIGVFPIIRKLSSERRKGTSTILTFKKAHYALTLIITATGCVSGYVHKSIIGLVGVIPSTIIGSAFGPIVLIMAALYFREKLTPMHIISAVLSIPAAILPAVLV